MSDGLKRYNLVLPSDLHDEIQAIADREQTTFAAIMRKFIKLGILVDTVNSKGDSQFILRENGVDKQVIL